MIIKSINPKDIHITVDKQIKDYGRTIPTDHYLNVENDILNLNVKIASINFHHISKPVVNYWRHHVRKTGKIWVDFIQKKIDVIEIS